ncbi:MAG: PQQ-binding-like beta-propeller repeat protein [Chloroflexi bacterium]|nr:PQQ-binding-like beta-propeller repeat protein [Chloroflexota bacterium]
MKTKSPNPPKILWQANLEQIITQPSHIMGEMAVFAIRLSEDRSRHSAMQVLNLADGTVCWGHTFEYARISGLQTYHLLTEQQEIIIVATSSSSPLRGQGGLFAFNQSGEIIWQWRGDAQHYSAPTVIERQVLVTAGGKSLIIVSPEEEGDSVTRIPLPANASMFAPIIYGNIAYIPCRMPELLAVELSGTVLWHFQTQEHKSDWLDQSPVIANDVLYTVSRRGTVFGLDAITGQMIWRQPIGKNRPLSRPAFADGRLYIGFQHGLVALDAKNGQTIWKFSTPRAISATPLVVGDNIYAGCEDHHFYAIDKENGHERWQQAMSRRIELSPTLTPTCLLVTDRGGTITALEPPPLPATALAQLTSSTSQLTRKEDLAKAYVERGYHAQAAPIWLDIGEFEKAATAYEKVGSWLEAAELWLQIDRYSKRAEALEKAAIVLTDQDVEQEKKALAWERAARAHAEIRQRDARYRCEREIARHRQEPVLSIEIEPEEMVVHTWSKLNFTVCNDGFGTAHSLSVALVKAHFEGHAVYTQTIFTLPPGKTYRHWLNVSPQVSGRNVPMQLFIEYLDKMGNERRLQRTFHLLVTSKAKTPITGNNLDDSRVFATLVSPDGRDLPTLRKNIIACFNSEELAELLFDLGLHNDDFSPRLSAKARQIVVWAVQHKQMDKLIELCKQLRPSVEW